MAYDVDPFVLAAIMDRESLGGDALTPKGAAGTGDGGRGRGLMQIDAGYHHTFIMAVAPDGTPLWADPAFNIMYAAKLLRFNLDRLSNDYAGSIAAYNASLGRVQSVLAAFTSAAPAESRIRSLDALTTGGNYLTHVLAKRDEFLSTPPRTVTPIT